MGGPGVGARVAEQAKQQRTAPDGAEGEWTSHALLSMLVRLVVVAVPISASVATAAWLSRVWLRPHGLAVLGWWFVIASVSTVVLVLIDRVARRLLPLAMLLKLSLVFPDKAPSRFAVAFRAGTVRNLQRLARDTKSGVRAGQPVKAAELVLTLLAALNLHDRRTRGHCERVRAFNDLLADELRLPQEDRAKLRWAALLHDIGKLHVPTKLLNKPAAPTAEEWEHLRSHPIEGAKLVAPLAAWLGPWSEVVVEHHERWDGGGYPYGLAGEQISLGGRIVAVADAYEVMTAPRPYRRPVSAEAARRELADCAGSHFDPAVVRAFLNISLGRLRAVIGPISWLAQLPFLGSVPKFEAIAGDAGRTAIAAAGTATGVGVFAIGASLGSAPATAAAPGPASSQLMAPASANVQVLASTETAGPAGSAPSTAPGGVGTAVAGTPSGPLAAGPNGSGPSGSSTGGPAAGASTAGSPGAASPTSPAASTTSGAPVTSGPSSTASAPVAPSAPTSGTTAPPPPAPAPTTTTTVSALATADALVRSMKSGLQTQPVERSSDLISHLDDYLSHPQISEKCKAMDDFISDTQGHTPDQVPADRSATLISQARTVKQLLGC